jgi:hypothetical protein
VGGGGAGSTSENSDPDIDSADGWLKDSPTNTPECSKRAQSVIMF